MRPSQINAVERIVLEAPEGVDRELVWFYGDLVGLTPVPVDAGAGVLKFRSARVELEIEIRSDPRLEPKRRRALISVGSLEWVMKELAERRITYTRISGLDWTDRRVSLLDPAGNRVELKQEWRPGVAPVPQEKDEGRRRGVFRGEPVR